MKRSLRTIFKVGSCSLTMVRAFATSASLTFFERIGNPKFISGPMVDNSDLPWRILTRRHGVDLAFSQMINANTFLASERLQQDIADWGDYDRLFSCSKLAEEARSVDQNLIVQLAGDDPSALVAAAKQLQPHVAAIDLNLGCPQRIAKRGNYGSFLLPQKDLVVECLSSLVQDSCVPITAKIRLLNSIDDTIDLCQEFQHAGIVMLSVHGRTKEANKQFTGAVDWEAIRRIKQSIGIPVVANGGISNMRDALDCFQITGVDAIMSAEGLLETPRMFDRVSEERYRMHFVEIQLETSAEYLRIVRQLKHISEHQHGCTKSHIFKFLFRLLSAPENFEIRNKLGKAGNLDDIELCFEALLGKYVAPGGKFISDEDAQERQLLVPACRSWYLRHRK